MNKTEIDNFVSTVAKTSEQSEAMKIILTYKHNREIKAAFRSLGDFIAYSERPEESAYRVTDVNGRTTVTKNTRRKLSSISEQEINQNWKNNASLRCEFPSFQAYFKWYEADILGRCKIKGQSSMV